ncbi:MAG TPA: NAD(P)-binding domain-containing protein [Balneolaceae bacterium]|nr:NAD(P)-binding domain-containing protein [Balneolaceae bacterium]
MPITKQTIAITGADGKIGTALAKRIAASNYRLLLLSNNATSGQSLAKQIKRAYSTADVKIMDCQYEACWEADIIIMAIPANELKKAADRIEEVATQKTVVYITALKDEALKAPETVQKSKTAKALEKMLPNSKIIELITTEQIFIDEKTADGFIIGRNENAIQNVYQLVNKAGINPIVVEETAILQ